MKLCNSDDKVCKDVIPLLVAFKSLMHIRDIQLAKAADALKAKEKAERTGKPPGLEEEEEVDPTKMTEEELAEWKLKKEQGTAEVDSDGVELTEDQIAAKAEEADRKIYGRTWIWDGYFNESRK